MMTSGYLSDLDSQSPQYDNSSVNDEAGLLFGSVTAGLQSIRGYAKGFYGIHTSIRDESDVRDEVPEREGSIAITRSQRLPAQKRLDSYLVPTAKTRSAGARSSSSKTKSSSRGRESSERGSRTQWTPSGPTIKKGRGKSSRTMGARDNRQTKSKENEKTGMRRPRKGHSERNHSGMEGSTQKSTKHGTGQNASGHGKRSKSMWRRLRPQVLAKLSKTKKSQGTNDSNKKPKKHKKSTSPHASSSMASQSTRDGESQESHGTRLTESSNSLVEKVEWKSQHGKKNRRGESWIGTLANTIGSWRGKDHSSMADLENERLGDTSTPPTRARNSKRLESVGRRRYPDQVRPLPSIELGSSNDSVSLELTVNSWDRYNAERNAPGATSLDPNLEREWNEIVECAHLIADHFNGENFPSRISSRHKHWETIQEALDMFRQYAARLEMNERNLFEAVRKEPAMLDLDSTFDDASLGDIWNGMGRDIDDRLDRYVDAIESVFEGMKCGGACGEQAARKSTRRRGRSHGTKYANE